MVQSRNTLPDLNVLIQELKGLKLDEIIENFYGISTLAENLPKQVCLSVREASIICDKVLSFKGEYLNLVKAWDLVLEGLEYERCKLSLYLKNNKTNLESYDYEWLVKDLYQNLETMIEAVKKFSKTNSFASEKAKLDISINQCLENVLKAVSLDLETLSIHLAGIDRIRHVPVGYNSHQGRKDVSMVLHHLTQSSFHLQRIGKNLFPWTPEMSQKDDKMYFPGSIEFMTSKCLKTIKSLDEELKNLAKQSENKFETMTVCLEYNPIDFEFKYEVLKPEGQGK